MAILSVNNKQFPGGNALPGGSTTPGVGAGAVAQQSAPTLALPDPAHAGQYLTYVFLFWNVTGATNSGIHSEANLEIHVGTSDVTATAWYVLTGTDGPPWTGVYTYAFSESQDKFLTDIPIDHTTPAAAWTPGNQKVETKAAVAPAGVNIVAESNLHGEAFDLWLTYSGGTAVGPNLHVDTNAAIWAAIAYYKVQAPVPPYGPGILDAIEAWQGIRNKLELVADPGPDDLWRMKELLDKARLQDFASQEDALSQVINTIDKMSKMQVRGNLAAVKAQRTRLAAAQKMLEDKLNTKTGK